MVEQVASLCWHCGAALADALDAVAACACGARNRITGEGQVAGFEASPETLAKVQESEAQRTARRAAWWRSRRGWWVAAAALLTLGPLVAYLAVADHAGGELGNRMREGDLAGDGSPYAVQYRFASEYAGTREGMARVDPASGLVAWSSGSSSVLTDIRHGFEFWVPQPAGPATVYRDYSPSAPMKQVAGRDVRLGLVLCPPQWAMCTDGFSGRVSHGTFTGRLDAEGRVSELHVDDDRWGRLDMWYTYGAAAPIEAPAHATRKGVEVQLDLHGGKSCFLGCSNGSPSAIVVGMRHSVAMGELELRLGTTVCPLDACGVQWIDVDQDGLVSQGDRFLLSGSLPNRIVLYDKWAQAEVYAYRASPAPVAALLAVLVLGAAALRRRPMPA